jgi:UDP-3-O-[3-hydroxymyristoyl] glucosamine N-acyltransferase
MTGRELAGEILGAARLLATDPAAALERWGRGVGWLRAQIIFRGCVRGERLFAGGPVRVVASGRVWLGDRVQFLGGIVPTEIVCRAGAELLLGAGCILNYGVSIAAARSVRIGERCAFGSFVRIRDESEVRRGPVLIGNDVWIAHGALVEPGVRIGDGSVVSAGSVVTADVPPGALAIGNPARNLPLQVRTPAR